MRGSGRKPGGVGNARRRYQARPFKKSIYNRQQASPQRNTTRRSQARYGTHRRAR